MSTAKRGPKRAEARRRPPVSRKGPPLWLPIAATLAVVAAALIIFVLVKGAQSPAQPPPASAAGLVAQIKALPASALDRVGLGSADGSRFQHLSGPPLTANGKPEILYIGAEYCPYCAAERWALVSALSRFGTFSGLHTITSSEGGVPTFTFHGATYTSPYLTFRAVEVGDGAGHPLDNPTSAESDLLSKYTGGSVPFVDFANQYWFEGATYNYGTLVGHKWDAVVEQLHRPGSPQAQGILGSSNLVTAAICQATDQQPADVCSDPVIQKLERTLPTGP